MKVLGIESSCDETACAIVEDGKKIISNVVATQIPFHQVYKGVVPEIASRKHAEWILPVVRQALTEANMTLDQVDAIAAAVDEQRTAVAALSEADPDVSVQDRNKITGAERLIFLIEQKSPFVAGIELRHMLGKGSRSPVIANRISQNPAGVPGTVHAVPIGDIRVLRLPG